MWKLVAFFWFDLQKVGTGIGVLVIIMGGGNTT